MKKFILGSLFVGKKLDVIDDQNVDIAIETTELGGFVLLNGSD